MRKASERIHLDDKAVANLPIKKRRYEVRDAVDGNISVRVSSTGKKTWYLRHTEDGQLNRISLGNVGVHLDAKGARKKAAEIAAKLGTSGDAAKQKAIARSLPALKEWHESWKDHEDNDWNSPTKSDHDRRFTKYVPEVIQNKRIDRITPADLRRIQRGIWNRLHKEDDQYSGARSTNMLISYIGRLLRLKYVEREMPAGWIDPAKAVKRKRERPSVERVLDPDEMEAFFQACEDYRHRHNGDSLDTFTTRQAAEILGVEYYMMKRMRDDASHPLEYLRVEKGRKKTTKKNGCANSAYVEYHYTRDALISQLMRDGKDPEKAFGCVQRRSPHEDPDTIVDMVEMMLFTGARKQDILAMAWDEIDTDNWVWTVPPRKTLKSHPRDNVKPLEPRAVAIIQKRQGNKSRWVFPAKEQDDPYKDIDRAFQRLVKLSGLPRFTPHDLRRTHATYQLLTGAEEAAVGTYIGHARGSKVTSQHYLVIKNREILRRNAARAVEAMFQGLCTEGTTAVDFIPEEITSLLKLELPTNVRRKLMTAQGAVALKKVS